jgi:hypothetical protein
MGGKSYLFMRSIFGILFITTLFVVPATAQSESALKKSFEGKSVTFRIDMPAREAVDLYPERSQSLNYNDYIVRLRNHGVSIERSEHATVTNIRVKARQIQVQFVADHQTRSRFDIHFARIESWMLNPATLINALSRFVEFTEADKSSAELQQSFQTATGYVRRGVVHIGPRDTYLKEGLSTEQVIKLLGEPSSASEHNEGGMLISTYEFPRSDGRILFADFVDNALIESRIGPTDRAAVVFINTAVLPLP